MLAGVVLPQSPADLVQIRLGRVRGAEWVWVSRGIHVRREFESDLRSELFGWQEALPEDACFTHLTGALARGWPVPPLPADLPVFAAASGRDVRPRRVGLSVTRHPHPVEFEVLDGLRVARPAEILLSAAHDLGLLDVVVLVDVALHRHDCTLLELWAAANRCRRGAPRLRMALRYADGRAESLWESVLRVLHQACDVPVEPQYVIPDDAGSFRADLRVVGTRRLVEYDGADHRSRERHGKDLTRKRAFHRLGWQRYGYTSPVLLYQGLAVLQDADEALAREHDPARIRAWHQLLAESLFTPAGGARRQERWNAASGGQTRQSTARKRPSTSSGTASLRSISAAISTSVR